MLLLFSIDGKRADMCGRAAALHYRGTGSPAPIALKPSSQVPMIRWNAIGFRETQAGQDLHRYDREAVPGKTGPVKGEIQNGT